jgi:hypothetical protein
MINNSKYITLNLSFNNIQDINIDIKNKKIKKLEI